MAVRQDFPFAGTDQAAAGHSLALIPGTVPHSSLLENICGYKEAGFPLSGVSFSMNDKAQDLKAKRYGPLPVIGLPVQVQCDGFKCMAFRDPEGRWVDLFIRKFVTRVLGVVPA